MRLPTWNKPRILFCYEFFPKNIGLPIGCLEELLDLLSFYDISPHIKDERFPGESIDVTFQGTLRPNQEQAVQALLKNETGSLSATTAFGKTVIALWIIASRRINTLILVHRKQLMEQWASRCSEFLGIPVDEIGQFGGGKNKRTGIIDVAVMQSVNKKGQVKDWVRDYGQIIVDECHHVSAFSFEQIIRKSPAQYKLGLSATVIRKGGQHPIIFMNLGRIRYTTHADTQAKERIFEHRIIPRETEFKTEESQDYGQNIQNLFRLLLADRQRNEQIVSDILLAYSEGREILILSERIEHLDILHEWLRNRVENLFVLKGGLGKKKLKIIMDELTAIPQNSNCVILATGRYLGEEIDLPFIDTLFLTFPVSWKGTITQYAGRLHRDYEGKTDVLIYDYVDSKVPVLRKMYERRKKGYKSLGYTIPELSS